MTAAPDPGGSGAGSAASESTRGGTSAGRLRVRNLDRASVLGDRVDVGASLWAKFRGLMGRPPLASGAGLWLPDSNGIHMMFMRFPIDAVFVGRRGPDGARPVVALRRALPAWVGLVPFVRGAHGVLELPVGAIEGSGTRVGDRLSLEPGRD